MIYHILPECEPLSAWKGGALAHTVSNLMRLDEKRVAICPETDASLTFSKHRVIVVPHLKLWGEVRARRFIPPRLVGPFFRWILRPMLERLRPGDIVWCHNRPVFASAIADSVHRRSAKLICHFHDALDQRTASLAFRLFTPDAAIFVSEYLREEWRKTLPGLQHAFTVHNGADEDQFFPRADSNANVATPVILFVGRLNPIKGAHTLIEAMKLLEKRNILAECRFVGSSFTGDSKPTEYMTNLLAKAPHNVKFTGFCSANSIGEVYRRADILCCPSIWQEPFGKVNVEAMGCGIPVVATRVGGIPEIAADGGIILIDPDSPIQLADALQKLIEDSAYRRQLGMMGLTSFRKNFTWRSALNRYKLIAESL